MPEHSFLFPHNPPSGGTLICPDECHRYQLTSEFIVPTADVTRFNQTYEVYPGSATSTIRSFKTVFTFDVTDQNRLYKFPHEFTYHHWTPESDKTLIHITNGRNYDDNDRLTPDEIIIERDFILVVEYTTANNHVSYNAAMNTIRKKRSKYYKALLDRVKHKPIYYYIFLTTADSVYSNFSDAPPEQMDELIRRFRFITSASRAIEMKFSVEIISTQQKTQNVDTIANMMSSIPFYLPDGTYFTDKVISNCTSDYNPTIEDPIAMNHLTKAVHMVSSESASRGYTKETQLNESGMPETVTVFRTDDLITKRLEDIKTFRDNFPLLQGEEVRMNHKAIIQFPYVVLKRLDQGIGSSTNELNLRDVGSSNENLFSFIKTCVDKIISGQVTISEVDIEEKMNDIMRPESEKMSEYVQSKEKQRHYVKLTEEERNEYDKQNHRMKYHRIEPLPNEDDARIAAVLGIRWKKYESQVLKLERFEKKKSFSVNCVTDDLDSFFNSSEHFHMCDDYDPSLPSRTDSLIKTTIKISESYNDGTAEPMFENHIRRCMNTKIGRLSKLISDVAFELCISLKQHCKPRQWIIKKLADFNMYLLIKPTSSSSHVFYIPFWYNEDMISSKSWEPTTKSIHTNGIISWCDVLSVNSSKLVNLAKCESQMISNIGFECSNFNICIPAGESILDDEVNSVNKARASVLLTFACMINDKGSLDELMSTIRFSSLEGFIAYPLVPNPGKMMKKLPIVLRSRLESWIINRVLTSYELILKGRYTCENVSAKANLVVWNNLIDPLFHFKLTNPDQLVSTFYTNYAKNKDETPEGNSQGKILNKILCKEDEMKSANRKYLGEEDNPDCEYNFHEFSPTLVRYCCNQLKEKFKRERGLDWQEELDIGISAELVNLDLESLSTLKASAAFKEDLSRVPHRPKAMEAMMDEFRKNDCKYSKVYEMIPRSLQTLQESGGLVIDIFRKQQHGGVREIYVLSPNSRIIQSFIECISRHICKQIPSEIMTHPANKMSLPSMHTSKVNKCNDGGNTMVTFCTSDDASKWSQGNFVTKFAIMLCQLLPPKYHNLIIMALDLWTRKRIAIPKKLLDMCDSYNEKEFRDLNLSDEYLVRLFKAYKGLSQERWMKAGADYILVESGMMQGILHYTSSAFHSILQETCRILFILLLHLWFKLCLIIITVMESSDDSGMLLSIPYMSSNELAMMTVVACELFLVKHKLGIMMGIYPSEKCTVGTRLMFEFNSEFFINGSLIRPTKKWVIASTNIGETESLISRQESFYGLSSQVLEGGGTTILAWICQVSQAYLHYRLLGSSVSSVWRKYVDEIMIQLDPTLGFFCIDSYKYAGMASVRFNVYLLLEISPTLSKKMKHVLEHTAARKSEESGVSLQDMLDLLGAGTMLQQSLIEFKDKKKWREMLENLNLPEDWLDQINRSPKILYDRAGSTPEEYPLRLAIKAMTPSASNSFYSGNVITRIISASVYILEKSVVSVMGGWRDPVTDEVCSKVSLLKKTIRETMRFSGENVDLSSSDKDFLFPQWKSYESLRAISEAIPGTGGKVPSSLKKKRVDVRVFESVGKEDYSLLKLVGNKWFDLPVSLTERQANEHFQRHKNSIKWLKDTPEETLESSPLCDQVSIRNFFMNIDQEAKVLHLTAAPVKSLRGVSKVSTVMLQNMWVNYRTSDLQEPETAIVKGDSKILSQLLFKTCTLGTSVNNSSRLARAILSYMPQVPIETGINARTNKQTLALIQDAVKRLKETSKGCVMERRDYLEWYNLCSDSGTGTFGAYIQRQTIDKQGNYTGPFRWVGFFDKCPVVLVGGTVNGKTVLKSIYTPSNDIHNCGILIKNWLDDNNVTTIKALSHGRGTAFARYWDSRVRLEQNKGKDCVPIYRNGPYRFLDSIADFRNVDKFDIVADVNAVRLVLFVEVSDDDVRSRGITKIRTEKMTILSLSTQYLENCVSQIASADLPNFIRNEHPFLLHWLSNTSLPTAQCQRILEALRTNDASYINHLSRRTGLNLSRITEIIRSSFTSSLGQFGVHSSDPAPSQIDTRETTIGELLNDPEMARIFSKDLIEEKGREISDDLLWAVETVKGIKETALDLMPMIHDAYSVINRDDEKKSRMSNSSILLLGLWVKSLTLVVPKKRLGDSLRKGQCPDELLTHKPLLDFVMNTNLDSEGSEVTDQEVDDPSDWVLDIPEVETEAFINDQPSTSEGFCGGRPASEVYRELLLRPPPEGLEGSDSDESSDEDSDTSE